MNAPPKLSKIEQLRARDGDNCWLCFGRLHFNAVPNSKKAPTLEHLTPLSKEGSSALENLVLCHPGCNRQLGNRPKVEKLNIRAKKLAARERQLAATATALASAAQPSRPARTARIENRHDVVQWQKIAVILAIVAIVAVFALGLVTGMLIAA